MPVCSKSSIITSKPAAARILEVSGPNAWRTPADRQISPRFRRSRAGFVRIAIAVRAESQEGGVRRQPQHELADQLEMRRAAVQVLGDRMDVAEAPLEWLQGEHGRGAGRAVATVDHTLGLQDRMRGGEPDGDTLGKVDLARQRTAPALLEGVEQEHARRLQLRLRTR